MWLTRLNSLLSDPLQEKKNPYPCIKLLKEVLPLLGCIKDRYVENQGKNNNNNRTEQERY